MMRELFASRNSMRARGMSFVGLLILAAVIVICAPLVMWLVGAAVGLLMLAIKIGVLILVFLVIVYGIKVMSKKVDS